MLPEFPVKASKGSFPHFVFVLAGRAEGMNGFELPPGIAPPVTVRSNV